MGKICISLIINQLANSLVISLLPNTLKNKLPKIWKIQLFFVSLLYKKER